ncbi:hypothetical protein F5Y16DRAFT_343274 [Xylariaceae sp. FL0255]|nr:hypothetical protein F5Y16DRAFT_343274 [Xylariaceae sp. FL0255]
MTSSTKDSVLVTGANGGLGTAILERIMKTPSLAKSYQGIYTVRKVETATAAKAALKKADAAGHKYELLSLDLSSLASTRKAAADINARVTSGALPPIRALILNAAWQEYDTHTMTDDGFDMTFEANYLCHYLLTLLLLKSMDKQNGRIVILGSWSHDVADKRNNVPGFLSPHVTEKYSQVFKEPLNTEPLARGKWSLPDEEPGSGNPGYRRYGASKLCQIMFMRELAKRIDKDPELSSMAAVSVDPGAMVTGLSRRTSSTTLKVAGKLLKPFANLVTKMLGDTFRTTAKSADDVVNAAFDTTVLGARPNGRYLDGEKPAEPGAEARDEKKCEKLWVDTLDYASIKDGDTILANWR